ncbi:hypothetical protein AB0L05_35410 [Nonomuraea pusilla]|uniref:hypothetical protein n=1 Tax=Nonomuraea pusilla TaxID=46177 RepID=UPI00331BAB4E
MPLLAVTVVGALNRLVHRVTGQRVVLYRFTGMPGVTLTFTGAGLPAPEQRVFPCLRDGEAYVVLKDERRALPSDVLLVQGGASVLVGEELDGRPVLVSPVREDPRELLGRLLADHPFMRRCEVKASGLVPFVRLEPDRRR